MMENKHQSVRTNERQYKSKYGKDPPGNVIVPPKFRAAKYSKSKVVKAKCLPDLTSELIYMFVDVHAEYIMPDVRPILIDAPPQPDIDLSLVSVALYRNQSEYSYGELFEQPILPNESEIYNAETNMKQIQEIQELAIDLWNRTVTQEENVLYDHNKGVFDKIIDYLTNLRREFRCGSQKIFAEFGTTTTNSISRISFLNSGVKNPEEFFTIQLKGKEEDYCRGELLRLLGVRYSPPAIVRPPRPRWKQLHKRD